MQAVAQAGGPEAVQASSDGLRLATTSWSMLHPWEGPRRLNQTCPYESGISAGIYSDTIPFSQSRQQTHMDESDTSSFTNRASRR